MKNTNQDMRVSINAANMKLKHVSFSYACNFIQGYLEADRDGCNYLVNVINKDQWFYSWVSEILGGVEPPVTMRWYIAITKAKNAQIYYKNRMFRAALSSLGSAINDYNRLHKRWLEYKNGVISGGESAVTIMETTVALTQVYIGVATGGGSVIISAGIGAGVIGATELTKLGGEVMWGLKSKVNITDFLDIGGKVVESFATSLLGGKLLKLFLGRFIPSFSQFSKINPDLALRAYKKGIIKVNEEAYKLYQRFGANVASSMTADAFIKPMIWALTKSAKKNKGKNMTFQSFIDDAIKIFIETDYKAAAQLFFTSLKKA